MTTREIVLSKLTGKKTNNMVFMPLCSRTYFRGLKEYDQKFEADWNDECCPIAKEEQLFEEIVLRVNIWHMAGLCHT
jgi:hypothetical protein